MLWQTHRPPPAGAGSVVNRCGGGLERRGRRAVRPGPGNTPAIDLGADTRQASATGLSPAELLAGTGQEPPSGSIAAPPASTVGCVNRRLRNRSAALKNRLPLQACSGR